MVKNILVAENNPILSMVKKYYFKLLGYQVTLSDRNGIDVLVTAKEYNPKIILMDICIEGKWMV